MKKINELIFFVLLAVIFSSIYIIPTILDMPNLYLINGKVATLSNGWTWKDDGYKEKFNLPHRFDVKKNEPLVIKNTLPDNLPVGSFIFMRSNTQSVLVKIDGETVYDVGNDSDQFLGRDLGDFWMLLKIESVYEGKEIEISLFSHRIASHGAASEVFMASESAMFKYLFLEKGFGNLVTPIILILGFILVFAYFIFGIYKSKNRGILYLGIFAILMGNWFLGESEMMQLLTENTYYITRISLLMTLIAPIPICLYMNENVMRKKRFFDDLLITLMIINTIVSLALEYFGILGLSDTVLVAIGLIVVVCLYYLANLIMEVLIYKSDKLVRELKAIFIIFISGVIEVASYFANQQMVSSLYLRIGVIIYIVLIIKYQFDDYRERGRIKDEREYFETKAYIDAMTGANNRARYMEEIENISAPEGIIVLQADTDRLKYINDYFGHVSGDQSIIDTYEVLNKNFACMGNCYRTGGDEFTVIIKNADIDEVNETIEKTRKDVELIAKERKYDFSISMGAAEYNASLDKDIYSTSIRADHKMYDDKKRLRNTMPVKMPGDGSVVKSKKNEED